MNIFEQIETIKSREELLSFIKMLRNDLKENKEGWQNHNLEDYLESIEAWLNDSDGLAKNTGKSIEDLSKWGIIASVLYSGKIYE